MSTINDWSKLNHCLFSSFFSMLLDLVFILKLMSNLHYQTNKKKPTLKKERSLDMI